VENVENVGECGGMREEKGGKIGEDGRGISELFGR